MTKNSFGLSKPLMLEILKMYWYVPVLSFVLYFFTGIFPILINIRRLAEMDYYIYNIMAGWNLGGILLIVLLPLVMSVLMMNFIHNESKSLTLHSQPISKSKLFNTRFLGGWLMCITPVVLNALLLAAISAVKDIPCDGGNVKLLDILLWFFTLTAALTFFYGLYSLTGALTGTTTMHVLTSIVMFVIFPVICFIIMTYCSIFLKGWEFPSEWLSYLSVDINPAIKLLFRDGIVSVKECIVYFAVGLVLAYAGKKVYMTRKLELIGTSLLSSVFEEILTYLITFVGMAVFGLAACYFSESDVVTVAAMVLGMIFTFTVVKIILYRTIKIFSRKALRSLAVCAAIGLVFTLFTIFDIGGYSRHVPEIEDIESVQVSGIARESYGGYIFGDFADEYCVEEIELKSEESIALVRDLHTYVVENGLYNCTDSDPESSMSGVTLYSYDGTENLISKEYITISYKLKNGRYFKRVFDVSMNQKIAHMIDAIMECSEFKEASRLVNRVNADRIEYVEIINQWTEYFADASDEAMPEVTNIRIENKNLIMELLEAKDKDTENRGYLQNNASFEEYIGEISIVFESPKKERHRFGKPDSEKAVYVEICSGDTNVINFLKKNGYGEAAPANEK